MAITGAIFNTLTFGGVNSGDYGIYISGEGVFNAPVRAVEMVSIPGRNGDLSLDLGHYENITVTYPAGVFGDDNVDFRERLSDFRNAILSQKGYQRLEDTYHPDEFRLGLYASGLDVEPVKYNEAGEFDLVFNCKPQRFLKSGEEFVELTSGDSLQNPTLFESSPLINLWGYGNLSFNGFEIDLGYATLGEVVLKEAGERIIGSGVISGLDFSLLNPGDPFYLELATDIIIQPTENGRSYFTSKNSPTVTSNSIAGTTTTVDTSQYDIRNKITPCRLLTFFPALEFNLGTSRLYVNKTAYGYTMYLRRSNREITVTNYGLKTTIEYRPESERLVVSVALVTDSGADDTDLRMPSNAKRLSYSDIIGNSSKSILGDPTVIDTETGEAYFIEDGSVVSLNKDVALGSQLPNLKPGDNEVTFEDTFSKIAIAPRWWKL